MNARRWLPPLLLALAGLAVLRAAWDIFAIRFGGGDLYPAYSSRNADPRGARALHDSLALLPGRRVVRLEEPLSRRAPGAGTTYFRLGGHPLEIAFLEDAELDALQAFVARGGRAVLAPEALGEKPPEFYETLQEGGEISDPPPAAEPPSAPAPETGSAPTAPEPPASAASAPATPASPAPAASAPAPAASAPGSAPAASSPARKREDPEEAEKRRKQRARYESLTRRLGFHLRFDAFSDGELLEAAGACEAPPGPAAALCTATRAPGVSGLPETLPLQTVASFSKLAPEWRVLYEYRGRPVVITREYGKGSIVLLADAWPLGNAALKRDRRTPLLAWLAGDSPEILFDDYALGWRPEPGVVAFLVRLRLQGLLAGLLLTALLVIWRMATGLAPAPDLIAADSAVIAGRGGAAGLLTLLQRALPPRRLLGEMVARWLPVRRSAGGRAARLDATGVAAVERLARAPGDPVKRYNEIHALLSEKK